MIVKGCKYPELVGDGYCNDETNKRQCDFDGGDCCYSNVSTAFCSDCKCLTGDKGVEINRPLIGDGYCHDETNNKGADIDRTRKTWALWAPFARPLGMKKL